MKKFGKMLGKAFVFCIVMIVLCSFVYPLALTGVSQLTMKNNANGNLIDKNGEPTNNIEEAVGSELVGQDFTEDYFFRGRVSSVNYDKIIYVFLTIFLYLLKCPQSLILSALRAFCFCGKPHISRSIFLYFRYQAWLKSW